MIVFDSVAINPINFPDAANPFQDGNVLDRYRAVVSFHMIKCTSQKTLSISGHTITNINNLDEESFLILDEGDSILPGEKFKMQGSVNNTGEYTVASVTATSITTVEALTAEDRIEVAYVYVTGFITALSFLNNLIGNTEQENYISKTDANVVQQYTVAGISATNYTPILLPIGTQSLAWVTDTVTSNNSTSTIVGAGITGVGQSYKQSFVIIHYYSIAPFGTKSQLANYKGQVPPIYFSGSTFSNGVMVLNALQYICSIQAKYSSTDSTAQNVGSYINNNGISSWFNQNNARTAPDWIFSSIKYVDASSNVLSSNDFSKPITVTIKLKSPSNSFSNGVTKIVLKHIYFPLDVTSYQNTPTTLWENFMYDEAVCIVGGSSVNGMNNGGNYQVIQGAQVVFVDSGNVTLTFTANYATFLKNILAGKAATDRNYGFYTTVE